MPNSSSMAAWTRTRGLVIGLGAAACLMAAGGRSTAGEAAQKPAQGEESWVRYSLPGTPMELTSRWQLLGSDGDQLVLKVKSYINGELRATREIKRARLRVPEQYRRETIVAGGKKYDCKVFQLGTTTYWYSEEVPLLGIVRSQNGDHDIMELLDSSARR